MDRFRKIFAIAAAILFLSLAANAQLRYGFRLGGSFADARLENAGSNTLSNKSGFSGGLMLEYQMPKCGLAADIAVLYTRFNTAPLIDGRREECFGKNFIEIPLHVKYKFWLSKFHDLFGPLVYTGPSVMIKAGGNSASPLASHSVLPGWDVGIGFDIVNFIQITGGYRFGLGNALKSSSEYPDARLRTNGWNVAANLIFDF